MQLPFKPDEMFPKPIRVQDRWISIRTYNACDTEAIATLSYYLPRELPNGLQSPRLAASAGTKMRYKVTLPKILEQPLNPTACICQRLQLKPQHLHPQEVNDRRHVCTTDINVIKHRYPHLHQALSLPPNFRPNEPRAVPITLADACNKWVQEISATDDTMTAFAITAANAASDKAACEYSMRSNQYIKRIPKEWEQELQTFTTEGGVTSIGDKEPVHVVMCVAIAAHLTIQMLSGSKRYIRTNLTDLEATQIMQAELDDAVGGGIPVEPKIANMINHMKTHKINKPAGMECRPTTNARNAGYYQHAKVLFQILKATNEHAKHGRFYSSIESTTQFVQALPRTLPRAGTADVQGFFTELKHEAIALHVGALCAEFFLLHEGEHIVADQRSCKWKSGPADPNNPTRYDIHKVIRLIQVILDNDYTRAGDYIYYAIEGVPMGATISSLLSNLTLHSLERLAIPLLEDAHNRHNLGQLFYVRYADDVFYSTTKDIFKAIMSPILASVGCMFTYDDDENVYTKGIPFLETRVRILQDNTVTTTHYSKSYEINPMTPRLPTKGGATRKSVYTQAIYTFCRAAYTTSTAIHDYITDVATLTNRDIHPKYSKRKIAQVAAQTLLAPKRCRYGTLPSKNELEKSLRLLFRLPADKHK